MKAGLFFGSFNPIHIGHLAIANFMVSFTDVDQVWFIVSPHNPLKERSLLIDPQHRISMVKEAIEGDDRLIASDIEFSLPEPSYSIDTLNILKIKFPDHDFVIIMGSDGLENFKQWKMNQSVIKNFQRYIYPRGQNVDIQKQNIENSVIVDAPKMDISSTFIRQSISENKDVRHFVPLKVWHYIQQENLYCRTE